MKIYFTSLFFILITISIASAQYPEAHYFIVPGTMSYRLDASAQPELSDQLIRGTYYGADVGGAMTPFNSAQYKDFALFHHPTNPNYIVNPDDVNNVPDDKFLINYRMAYPSDEYYDLDTASREQLYPLIVFMHGAGERANCWRNSCYGTEDPRMWNNDHNVRHGGNQHLKAINAPPSDPDHWPGFVAFPQSKNGYNKGSSSYTARVIVLVETLLKKYPIDPNRVYIHGLSNGAQGIWMLLHSRPDLFAASAPMSGYRSFDIFHGTEAVSMDTTMIHIPIWQFQGGEDTNPRPENTEKHLKKLRAVGGTPRYTLYPNLGHSVWNTAYREPDFFSWFLQYSKLTIHAYYGVSEVCDIENMSVRLGISKGFDAYEWRITKNGVTTSVEPSSERPNEIIATELGSYQVRFARGTEWTEWSEPYTLTPKDRPTARITANGSTALPGLDGSEEVKLSTNESGIYYKWYKNDELYRAGDTLNSITVSDPGGYSLVMKDEGQCEGEKSNIVYVSIQPYGAVPEAPQNLSAVVSSENAINLYWEDHSGDELGFEVYRSLNGTDYTWVTTTSKNIIMYTDSSLTAHTEYHYKIRAYNRYGASEISNITSVTTSADSMKPSAPSDFSFDHFAYSESRVPPEDVNGEADEYFEVHTDQVVLSWLPASDNIAVNEYRIYFADGRLAGSTVDTTITIEGLGEGASYSFYVVAIDGAGNVSTPSNSITVTTVFEGLYFNLYAGGTWDVVKNFSNWAIQAMGEYPNFSLSAKDGLYDEGDDYFAFDFFGYIYIKSGGEYTFYTKSDDGSQLWIGDQKVVDNDGTRENSIEKSGSIELTAGVYPITVKYFDRSGGEELIVYYESPAMSKQPIPDEVLRSGSMPDNIDPPAIPAGVVATADEIDFSITLTWNDQNENPKFEIYRSKGDGPFEIIHTTGAGEFSYEDNDLEPNQAYNYKLKATTENGASDFSNTVSATTTIDTEPPSIPKNLVAQSITDTKIALSWNNSTDNVGVTAYVVTYDFATDEDEARTMALTETTVRNGITIDNLEPQTSYTFTVAARDASGNLSGDSEPLTVETLSESSLPVTFIDFSYSIASNQVILQWRTGSEINNDYFSVERAKDSDNFLSIGKVNGSGTTDQTMVYEFIDTSPLNSAYYRIKQVDFDGNQSASKVIRVTVEDIFDALTVYPNPTSPANINIKGYVPTERATIDISLYDVMGKSFSAVAADPNSLLEGVNININKKLHPGVYIVVVSDGTNISQKRVIIE